METPKITPVPVRYFLVGTKGRQLRRVLHTGYTRHGGYLYGYSVRKNGEMIQPRLPDGKRASAELVIFARKDIVQELEMNFHYGVLEEKKVA